MFSSDLEVYQVAGERHKDLLKSAEQRRRALNCKIRGRSALRMWVGTQLIVLGQRVKGDFTHGA